jgi:hypothetical protein
LASFAAFTHTEASRDDDPTDQLPERIADIQPDLRASTGKVGGAERRLLLRFAFGVDDAPRTCLFRDRGCPYGGVAPERVDCQVVDPIRGD